MTATSFDHRCAIAALGLFDGVPGPVVREVAVAAHVRTLPKGMPIFEQGERTRRAHALLSGAVRISQIGSDGEQVTIRFIGPGEIFGSLPIYTDHLYPADAVAMIDCVEASWDEAALLGLMERCPRIAINMIGIIGRRMAELQDRVRELATQRAERRIAHALLRVARQTGRPSGTGMDIGVPLRRKDIADISGTTLHTVSRTLAAWERRGILGSTKLRLTLYSTADIERIAET